MLFIVLSGLLVAACENRTPRPKTETAASTGSSQTPGQRLDQATDQAKKSAGDAATTAKVKAALANDVGLKTLGIDVDSNSGVVTLKGQVDSLDTKNRAQAAAQQVKGVTYVHNQLSLAPGAK